MMAFEAHSQMLVQDLHAIALSAGGSDEGLPDFRDEYGPHFSVGYFRDQCTLLRPMIEDICRIAKDR